MDGRAERVRIMCSGIAIFERSSNYCISFISVITDNRAIEGFKAEGLVHSVVFRFDCDTRMQHIQE
jgi:hypothetical protein